jgi:SAM-dependent methyltransferase
MFRVPAEAYDRFVGRYAPALAVAMCDAAGIAPPGSALDVGCGPGALAAELASRLGRDQVAAVDPSESFAAACRDRLPGVRVEVAAAEALPFPDAAFDAALAQLVVHFMTDAPAGVREMRRVARGPIAASTWDFAGGMTLLRTFWDAAAATDAAAAERDEGRSMPYCTRDSLGELWRSAGLEPEVGEAVVSAHYEGFEDLWAPFELGVGPAGAYTGTLDPPARAALKDELRRRLGAGEEPFELTARAWIVVGR